MASASDVIEMLLTPDAARARELAQKLHALNQDRQQTERDIAEEILRQCARQPVSDRDAALVFAGEGWHRGVVGIVASRVVERFHRPAFVVSIDNGVAQGSGRSIPQFHLLEALEAMPELFTKFGGHRQAAGVTLEAGRIAEFRERLRTYAAERLRAEDFEPELALDGELDVSEITAANIAEIFGLAPFGFGNPAPRFALRGLELAAPPEIKNEKHVFLRLRAPGGRGLRAKAWGLANRTAEFAGAFDAAVQFEEDAWSARRGYAGWQMVVKDVRAVR
jgi:single-stranded-DNA-specific exonuclease